MCRFYTKTFPQPNDFRHSLLDESGRHGTLKVLVFDSFGRTVDGARISLQRRGGNAYPKAQIAAETSIEYGAYHLVIEKPGHETASKDLEIHDAQSTVVVGLIPGVIEKSRESVLVGRLLEGENPGCASVRLVPMLASAPALDANVHQGQFVLANVKPGNYLVLVLGPKGICRTSEVAVELRESQTITIP